MNNKAIYAVVCAALIAGFNGILIKYMSSMPAGMIAWFRTFIPVMILIPFLHRKKELHFKGNNKNLLLASGINAVRMYLYLVAFIYTSIGNAVVLFYTYPIFVTIIEAIFLKNKIKKQQIFYLFLAFGGIVLTYAGKPFSFASRDFIGMISALGASIGYAITVILFKAENKKFSQNQMIFYQNIVGAVIFLPFLIHLPTAEISHLGTAVFYAFLIGIVVFKLFFYGLQQLTAATASTLMYLEVVSAILLGYLILNEDLIWNTFVGGFFILLSSYLITRINSSENKSAENKVINE